MAVRNIDMENRVPVTENVELDEKTNITPVRYEQGKGITEFENRNAVNTRTWDTVLDSYAKRLNKKDRNGNPSRDSIDIEDIIKQYNGEPGYKSVHESNRGAVKNWLLANGVKSEQLKDYDTVDTPSSTPYNEGSGRVDLSEITNTLNSLSEASKRNEETLNQINTNSKNAAETSARVEVIANSNAEKLDNVTEIVTDTKQAVHQYGTQATTAIIGLVNNLSENLGYSGNSKEGKYIQSEMRTAADTILTEANEILNEVKSVEEELAKPGITEVERKALRAEKFQLTQNLISLKQEAKELKSAAKLNLDESEAKAKELQTKLRGVDSKYTEYLPKFILQAYKDGDFGDPKSKQAKLTAGYYIADTLGKLGYNIWNVYSGAWKNGKNFENPEWYLQQMANSGKVFEKRLAAQEKSVDSAIALITDDAQQQQKLKQQALAWGQNSRTNTTLNIMNDNQKAYLFQLTSELGLDVAKMSAEQKMAFMNATLLMGEGNPSTAIALIASEFTPEIVEKFKEFTNAVSNKTSDGKPMTSIKSESGDIADTAKVAVKQAFRGQVGGNQWTALQEIPGITDEQLDTLEALIMENPNTTLDAALKNAGIKDTIVKNIKDINKKYEILATPRKMSKSEYHKLYAEYKQELSLYEPLKKSVAFAFSNIWPNGEADAIDDAKFKAKQDKKAAKGKK